mmetsp:Transcript_4382/g.14339  ORF Transcript_4382/g.14339 Transcript_4382/m.14339 type:complete len:376 (-) Transcript_4382:1238-2365(-)
MVPHGHAALMFIAFELQAKKNAVVRQWNFFLNLQRQPLFGIQTHRCIFSDDILCARPHAIKRRGFGGLAHENITIRFFVLLIKLDQIHCTTLRHRRELALWLGVRSGGGGNICRRRTRRSLISATQLSNIKRFELFPRFGTVHGFEIFSRIFTGIHGDGRVATGMRARLQVRVDIVHFTLDDNPAIVFSVVLFNFLSGDVSHVRLGRFGRDIDCDNLVVRRLFLYLFGDDGVSRQDGHRYLGHVLLARHARARGFEAFYDGLPSARFVAHPTTLECAGLGRVLALNVRRRRTAHRRGDELDSEVTVVTHTHQIPREITRLCIVRFIPCAAHYLLCPRKLARLDVELPKRPAPMLPIHRWLARPFHGCQSPHVPTI